MERVPEKGRDTTGQGRATGPDRNDHLDGAGRVSYLLSAVTLELTCSRGRRSRINVSLAESGDDGRSGGAEAGAGRFRETAVRASMTDRRGSDGTLGRPEGGRGNVKSAVGRDSVEPLSAGWRNVARVLDATEGMSHE